MDKGLARLAKDLGIPADQLPGKIGVSTRAIALIDKGHAVLTGAGVRVVAKRLGTTEARVREAMSAAPEPRSAEMESRLGRLAAELERQLGGESRYDLARVEAIAAACFPDELERKQVMLFADPPGWKHAIIELGPQWDRIDDGTVEALAARFRRGGSFEHRMLACHRAVRWRKEHPGESWTPALVKSVLGIDLRALCFGHSLLELPHELDFFVERICAE